MIAGTTANRPPPPRYGTPIPFPNLAHINRAHAARIERELLRDAARVANAQRQAEVIRAAFHRGRDEGTKRGYMHGWQWGLACGAAAGVFAGIGLTLAVQWLRAFSALVP